ncbi:MAG: helix-turn-helix domain-containing protein [Porticoccaceae bacterium]|nr:helix-turn-helix domain-containing protein [Porticoccaceae bacterium]
MKELSDKTNLPLEADFRSSMKDLDIGEVAQRSGVTPATLRYYEKRGLIVPSGRNGLRRLYDPSVLMALSLIRLGQKVGFSLEEIKSFVSPAGETNIPKDSLETKAQEIDLHIQQLTAFRDGLRHVAKCTAPSHSECPKFQRIMNVALRREGG